MKKSILARGVYRKNWTILNASGTSVAYNAVAVAVWSKNKRKDFSRLISGLKTEESCVKSLLAARDKFLQSHPEYFASRLERKGDKKQTEHTNVKVKELTDSFDRWAEYIKERPTNTFGTYLETTVGEVYVRNTARGILSKEPVFCIARIILLPKFQGKGIFAKLVEHVCNNPHIFKEIEIENVLEERFCNFLKTRGFNIVGNEQTEWLLPTTLTKKL